MFEPIRINSVNGCADLEGSLGYMCFCDPNMDHLHLGLSVGWLVSLSKDLLKKLTIIDKILFFAKLSPKPKSKPKRGLRLALLLINPAKHPPPVKV